MYIPAYIPSPTLLWPARRSLTEKQKGDVAIVVVISVAAVFFIGLWLWPHFKSCWKKRAERKAAQQDVEGQAGS
ncbi:hypothetical protein ACJ41O_010572 [Fusarium nematophilum]